MLRKLRTQSEKKAIKEYGVEPGTLRFFVHYQPTYCESSLLAVCGVEGVRGAQEWRKLIQDVAPCRSLPRPHREPTAQASLLSRCRALR